MQYSKILNHRSIFIFSLILIGFWQPLSVFLTSTSAILVVINWLLEGNFKSKWERFSSRPGLMIFSLFFFIPVLWLLNSASLGYGLHDLKIKMPILFIPLIIGTSAPLSKEELKWVLHFFVLGVLISSLISLGVLLGLGGYVITNYREISLFISHIRFSLLIDLAIFTLGWYLYKEIKKPSKWIFPLRLVILLWLVAFLFILRSLTGLFIFFLVGGVLFGVILAKQKKCVLKYIMVILVITAGLIFFLIAVQYTNRFLYKDKMDISNLPEYTANGNAYKNIITEKQVENGHYVWLYVCDVELKTVWEERSKLKFTGKDEKGQELRYTLIRYLSSKGLRKDSAGVTALSDEEIHWIEQGTANFIYKQRSLYALFYEVFWQIKRYREGGNPSGHSVVQRLEYLKAGVNIVKNHFWLGVGTGDVPEAFEIQYNLMDSQLSPQWRLRAHNQYLTFLLTFGIFGFMGILAIVLFPPFIEKGWKNYFFIVFLSIALLSMIDEDTLETSAGVMFFAYFYGLFLFGSKQK